MTYQKALPRIVGIPIAKDIWEILDIKNTQGERAILTEKDISIKTWQGCNEETYTEYSGKYKRLNTMVMEDLRLKNGGKEVVVRWNGKLCMADEHKLRQSVKFKVTRASGFLANAQRTNTKNQLKIDVYGNVIAGTIASLTNQGFSADESKEIMVAAVQARRFIENKSNSEIKEEITRDVLSALEDNKQIEHKDNEMVKKYDEKFGEDANKRRKKDEKDNEMVKKYDEKFGEDANKRRKKDEN